MSMYETQRVVFDKIVEKYNDYVALYALCNDGSEQGATSFREFYWRYIYLYRYQDPADMRDSGY